MVPFFRDYLQCPEGWEGAKTKGYSTNETVMNRIDHPAAKLMTTYRTMETLHGTFIKPYLKDQTYGDDDDEINLWPDGRIHTKYNHSYVATGRLSSDSPNIQNFPREHSWIRRIIVPSPGRVLIKNDYGQIEARVLAMVSKDPFLMKALWTKV